MGRNEIKLRRQLVTGRIQRYRNYSALLKRHERSKQLKRNIRFFAYSLFVTVVVVLFLIIASYLVVRLENKQKLKKNKEPVRTSMMDCRIAELNT
jgi:large-conductance mechanosensitive channel